MDELVGIIRKLVGEIGIVVLSDKRTCNIVNDLSSTFRNNKDYQQILKVIVENGLMDSIIESSHDNRFIEIAHTGKRIKEKYWLDSADSIKILCALSLGADLITKDDCDKFLFGDNSVRPSTQNEKDQHLKSNTANGRGLAIDPREPYVNYKFPTCDLLKRYNNSSSYNPQAVKIENNSIVEALNNFGIHISKITATYSPLMKLFEVTPSDGTTIRQFRLHESDIAINLGIPNLRIVAPVPGRGTVGIEIPNDKPQIVSIESVLKTKRFQDSHMNLPIALGINAFNEVAMVDLTDLPHLLLTGATGQGKSVCLNTIITSL